MCIHTPCDYCLETTAFDDTVELEDGAIVCPSCADIEEQE